MLPRPTHPLLLVLLLAGCGGPKGDNATPPPPPVCANTTDRSGLVTVYIDAEPILQSGASARFVDQLTGAPTAKCTTTTAGACTVVDCVPVDPAPDPRCTNTKKDVAAGSIGVSGGKSSPLTLTSDAKRAYAGLSSPGERWAPGDALKVVAGGGDVPGFDATLTFPARVAPTGPADYVAKKSPIEVDWRAGITLTWLPGVGTVWMHLVQGDLVENRQTTIDCRGPSTAGSLVMPSDALSTLHGNRAPTIADTSLEVYAVNDVPVTAGDFKVIVRALYREERRTVTVKLDGVPAK